jgi:hypothetical protein
MEKKPRKKAAKATEKAPARPIIRSEKGTFLPGSGGGPGRKPQEVEREYLEATMAACTPAQWARIVEKAVEETQDDDPRVRQMARGFLLKALMGSSPSVVMQYANVIKIEQDSKDGEFYRRLLAERMAVILSEDSRQNN